MRILVADGGLHHDRAFSGLHGVEFLRAQALSRASLELYDVLIVPFHTDQIVLFESRGSLERFARLGGVLVVLGATEEGGRPWVPFAQWEGPYKKAAIVDRREARDVPLLFRELSDEALKYHGVYAAHGSLLPNGPSTPLAHDEDGRIIMFARRRGIRGTYLCTTLDPDFHSCSLVPGPDEESTAATRRNASLLLQNIVSWAEREARGKPVWNRFARKALGYVKLGLFGLSFWALVVLPASVLV